MATQLAPTALPASVAALPFLLARPQIRDRGWHFEAAFAAAVAAERPDGSRRNTRGRLSYLLCELGFQLARRGGSGDGELPVTRVQLAEALGVSLCRIKRALALLTLSQVIATEGGTLRVLDWQRLCSVACYDRDRLGLFDQDEELLIQSVADDEPANLITAAGDPACFV
jgi:hypothetical protein